MGMICTYLKVTAKQLEQLEANSEVYYELLEAATEGDCIDTDKAWGMLHFIYYKGLAEMDLLENTAPLLVDNLFFGGEALDEVIRLFSKEQVQGFATELQKIDLAVFTERFDLAAMIEKNVYPLDSSFTEENAEWLEYSWQHFEELQAFFAEASTEGKAVVTSIM